MTACPFNAELLDTLRSEGDPLADATIDALFACGEVGAVNRAMRALLENHSAPPPDLPPAMRDYLDRTSHLPAYDADKRRRAEAIFAKHGPSILIVLGFYALPAAYAAKNGVQVLHRTSYLIDDPVRRLDETAQMVIDVMAPGALDPAGRGVRTAQKVRLMHAAVRRHALHDRRRPWDPSLGLPINQEDLAGTLMTFSYVVLEGLGKLGIRLPAADRDAWIDAWNLIGRLLGADPRVLPADDAEARALTALIRERQIAASPEGQQLTAALVRGLDGRLPRGLSGASASLIRYFLESDPFRGEDVASLLGVPHANWTRLLPPVLALGARLGGGVVKRTPLLALATEAASRRLIHALLAPTGGAARFAIPEELAARWGASSTAARDDAAPARAPRCPFHRLSLSPGAAPRAAAAHAL